jgi:hypothetical protein
MPDARAHVPTPHHIDRRILLGLALTALWLGLTLAYIGAGIGWRAFFALPPSEIGNTLEGFVSPLAFLWLVLGLFLQQSELGQNSRALTLQSEALQKSAEQAEIQARAIHANELHARQDTFVDLVRLVNRQLGVISGLLYLSSQAMTAGGSVPTEKIAAFWTQLGAGDNDVFMRGLLGSSATSTPQQSFDLFYSTPVRTRHTEAYVAAFARLLRAAESCDPDGLIRDAILGDGSGRLFLLMTHLRDNPPLGARIVPAG